MRAHASGAGLDLAERVFVEEETTAASSFLSLPSGVAASDGRGTPGDASDDDDARG